MAGAKARKLSCTIDDAESLTGSDDACSLLDELIRGVGPVSCTPGSGSVFAVGVSVVTCAATDAAGNNSQGALSMMVSPFVPGAESSVPVDVAGLP